MNNLNRSVVTCVDVDGTLIAGQSQKLFLDFLYQKRIVSFFYYVRILIWFLLYKIHFVHNPEKVMNYAYAAIRGWSKREVDALADEVYQETLRGLVNKKLQAILNQHHESGAHILLISNSSDIIVRKLAEHLDGVEYRATKLEIENGVYTGLIVPPIMYGAEKVFALEEFLRKYALKNAYIITYTDHISDLPLLMRSDECHAVNPHGALKRIAKQKAWDIMEMK